MHEKISHSHNGVTVSVTLPCSQEWPSRHTTNRIKGKAISWVVATQGYKIMQTNLCKIMQTNRKHPNFTTVVAISKWTVHYVVLLMAGSLWKTTTLRRTEQQKAMNTVSYTIHN